MIVDDEERMRLSLGELFDSRGYRVTLVSDAQEALACISACIPDAALIDLCMPGLGGLELLQRLRSLAPWLPVIVMTGYPSVEAAVLAMKYGAMDFHTKPLDIGRIHDQLDRILGAKASQKPQVSSSGLECILGSSPAICELRSAILRIAPTDASVVINGETGTGKDLIAEAIHRASKRSEKTYVSINCAAIPGELLESELFGHERGAFTGATERKIGLFEAANGGTVFLDEIGDLDGRLQAKLLRVLQGGDYRRVGGTRDLNANVRVVAATNKDLIRLMAEGLFREDLFYRLSVICLSAPPLRQRLDDIPVLATHFAAHFARVYGKEVPILGPGFLRVLEAQAWTGNVRELKNCMERALIFCDSSTLEAEHLPGQYLLGGSLESLDLALTSRPAPDRASHMTPGPSASIRAAKEELERRLISEAINKTGGNRSEAARMLGLKRRTLYNRLDKLGLDSDADTV